jgi:hypothetical protein
MENSSIEPHKLVFSDEPTQRVTNVVYHWERLLKTECSGKQGKLRLESREVTPSCYDNHERVYPVGKVSIEYFA